MNENILHTFWAINRKFKVRDSILYKGAELIVSNI